MIILLQVPQWRNSSLAFIISLPTWYSSWRCGFWVRVIPLDCKFQNSRESDFAFTALSPTFRWVAGRYPSYDRISWMNKLFTITLHEIRKWQWNQLLGNGPRNKQKWYSVEQKQRRKPGAEDGHAEAWWELEEPTAYRTSLQTWTLRVLSLLVS